MGFLSELDFCLNRDLWDLWDYWDWKHKWIFFLQNPLNPKNPGSDNSLAVQAFLIKKPD
jgi:hypothetical protein